MRHLKSILSVLVVTTSLTGCARIADTFDGWGKSMPTYKDTWCDGWFCWNDTTTKQEAFSKETEAQRETHYYPSENGMEQPGMEGMMPPQGGMPPMPPPPGMEGNFQPGMIPPPPPPGAMGMTPPANQMPWKGKKKNPNELPEEFDPNNPPPGAIPGVNWPPPPPEGGYGSMYDDDRLPPMLDVEPAESSGSDSGS